MYLHAQEGERGRERAYGEALRKERRALPGLRGGVLTARTTETPQPRIPRDPYNTVASRIRNLLLIIMLSILTRHSYFSPSPHSLLESITRRCPERRTAAGHRFTGFDRYNPDAKPVGLATRFLRDFFGSSLWIVAILRDSHHVRF